MRLDVTLAEILSEFQGSGALTGLTGDAKTRITGISAVESASPGDLVFVDKKDYLSVLLTRRPAAVVTTAKLAPEVVGFPVLIAPNVALAHALLKQKYADRDFTRTGWTGVHPTAVVHESAELAADVVVEPRAVIGQGCKIGAGTRVMAGVVIENNSVVGERCVLHPNCVIGYDSVLGNEVVVGAGSVIGSEGYGFAQDAKRRSYPIPQTGRVVLEDRVRLGSNCSIDRATYSETRIGAGTKLDNLCHVAHNVQIGEDCLLTAMLCVAGSTKIGARVIASGQTGISDHMEICSDAVLLHRAGVTQKVEKPGAYAGLPLQPLGDYMRNVAVLKTANDLRKRVLALEKGSTGAASETPAT